MPTIMFRMPYGRNGAVYIPLAKRTCFRCAGRTPEETCGICAGLGYYVAVDPDKRYDPPLHDKVVGFFFRTMRSIEGLLEDS